MSTQSSVTGAAYGSEVNSTAARDLATAAGTLFALGRGYTVLEALTILRRATFDPGAFTTRVRYRDDEMETIERWQARAALVGLSCAGLSVEEKWSQPVGHFTTYEVTELEAQFGAEAASA